MLGEDVRQRTLQKIDMVHSLIVKYLRYYMTQKEVTQMMLDKEKIEPIITEIVWGKLEEQNEEFFRAYHLKVMLKEQIMEFNRLLQRQAERMHQVTHQASFTPMHQSAAYCAQENSGPALRTEHMRQHVTTNSPVTFTNPSIPTASDMYVHSGRFVVPSNIRNSNVGMLPGLTNGGMMRTEEADYGMCGGAGGGNLLETRGDVPLSSFTSLDSQPMSGTLLDSLQPWSDFSLFDLTDITDTSGILDSYSGTTFRETLLDSHDGIEEHQGTANKKDH